MITDKTGETNVKKTKFSVKLALGIIAISAAELTAAFLVVHTVVRSTIYDNAVNIVRRDMLIRAREIDACFLKHSQLVEHIDTALG